MVVSRGTDIMYMSIRKKRVDILGVWKDELDIRGGRKMFLKEMSIARGGKVGKLLMNKSKRNGRLAVGKNDAQETGKNIFRICRMKLQKSML